MRKLYCLCLGLWLCGLLAGSARAETYQMSDGVSLTGEVVSFNESGMIVRLSGDKYSDRIAWTKLSQDTLKKLAENPKILPLVEPFIEASLEAKSPKAPVEIRAPERLKRPEPRSLLGALLSSSVGLFVLLMIYVANCYAAYELARQRARPVALVCGVSALLPVLGPILFLVMPVTDRGRRGEEEEESPPAPSAPIPVTPGSVPSPAATRPFLSPNPAIPGMHRPSLPSAAPGPGAPKSTTAAPAASAGPGPAASSLPQKQVFQRGAFTFNRRFFETKFAGFLGVVPRDADKDMVLVVKSVRGEYVGQRITRLTASEFMLLVRKETATEEVMIPFTEVKEIILQHKDG
jgi:hypothetical protein